MREQKDLKSLNLCNEEEDEEREGPKQTGSPTEHIRDYDMGSGEASGLLRSPNPVKKELSPKAQDPLGLG